MSHIIILHIIGFSLGVILDLIIGDPYNFPHPIRVIGNLISFLDKHLLKENVNENHRKIPEILSGILVCILVIGLTFSIFLGIMAVSFFLNEICFVIVEAILTCYILAAKSLCKESMRVYYDLEKDDIEKARISISMIVGRDTKNLTKEAIVKAAVETVAENTSDGVIAPFIYTFIGGPILGFVYKSINTMDSMIGYHSDRYEYFGKAAALLDDIVNFIPARLSAIFMILASFIGKIFGNDYKTINAIKIWIRDRYNHKSPNSAQTESVAAGALGIKLAGDAYYFGKLVKKPFIGDALRDIAIDDIKSVNRLMFITEGICFLLCILIALIFIV